MGEFGTPIEVADFGDPHPLSSGIFEFPPARADSSEQTNAEKARRSSQRRITKAA